MYLFTDSTNNTAAEIWIFDLINLEFKRIEDESYLVKEHSANVKNEYIYIFGGYTIECKETDQLKKFNVQTKKLENVETTGLKPHWRRCHGSEIIKNDLYIFAGVYRNIISDGGDFGNENPLNDLFKINLDTLEWTKIDTSGDIPEPR